MPLLTNQKWNQNQSWLVHAHFPILCVGYEWLLQVLIGLLDVSTYLPAEAVIVFISPKNNDPSLGPYKEVHKSLAITDSQVF